MTSFAITGASGQLGRMVADEILTHVDAQDVVLLSRAPDALSDYAARGAVVRHADFGAPDTLAGAFEGVDRVLLISTSEPGKERVAGHRAAIDAAAAAGVSFIAYTSGANPSDSNPIPVVTDHRQTEDHLRASGVAWTFLRNNIYTEQFVPTAQGAIATGSLATNAGDGRTAYVTRVDCAAVAAAVLRTPGQEGKALDVTGPEAIGAEAQAALIAEITGTPIEVVHLDDAAYAAMLVEHAGLPAPVAELVATFGTGTRLGYQGAVAGTVADLTGREPTSLRAVLEAGLAG
jgi:NAD(P)H dehydrogenase (quinone)